MLSCSICYIPSKAKLMDNVKYTCWDNKIHLRFRDYKTAQNIKGFESKLTYLISYLFNYCYLPTVLNDCDNDKLLSNFLSNSDLNKVLNAINIFINPFKTTGFKIGKNYNKSTCKYFGDNIITCFPLTVSDGIVEIGSLNQFLSNFGGISLQDYLFNDGYEIHLRDFDNSEKLNKFQRKDIKRQEKINSKNIDLVDLW